MHTPNGPGRPLVSLVVPALNEAENIPALLAQVTIHQVNNPEVDFELVLVDDGSSDGTADVLRAATPLPFATQVVELSRNFGSHSAISAGLERCRGDCAIVLGADAQEPPDLVTRFLSEWRSGHQVVWGIRGTRAKASLPRRASSKAFSLLFTRVAHLENYPAQGPSGMLVDRAIIEDLNRLGERNRNVLALVAWLGYDQTSVTYEQSPRAHGASRWTATKMVKLAVDSMIQFSSLPLRLCTFTGLATAALGLVYAVTLVVRSWLGVDTPSGWPTLLVVVLVLGGIQLTVIGMMGEYVWRIVEEVRHRPLYVVRKQDEFESSQRGSTRT